ncbi:putative monocarboxylate transporter [Diplodia seriata]|uniref:Putative monocarboxylate transporter n=1 Tax=Diplodia seriata TaxID=420778 RepID=A0A0G2EU44_9PEZI|nr:putative monocarboxylate transporter [Diplodia seriata]
MSVTATTTATTTAAVELEPVSRDAPAWVQATAPNDPDNVVEASRIADANVPDGGYGWVIVAAGALLSWWFIGTSYCWGVIQNALVEQRLSSASTLAFVGSVTVACNAVFAATSAQVLRKLGARSTGLLGASLLGLGYVLAGFCTHSVPGLFITAGLITGVGIRYGEL